MANLLDMLESLIEQVPQGYRHMWSDFEPRRETVVRPITESEISAHKEIYELDSELRASLRTSLRLIRLIQAKRVILRDNLALSDERLETADLRGKHLGFRVLEDDTPVVVEFDPESCDFGPHL